MFGIRSKQRWANILGSALLFLSAPARAHDAGPQRTAGSGINQIHGVRFDVHANLDPWGMFGAGGRIEFAIAPRGVLTSTSVVDELALSFGADALFVPFVQDYYTAGGYVVPIAALQWNFYLPRNWSVFPELGVAVHFGFRREPWRGTSWAYAWPNIGFGARYHFDDRLALLMRISAPGGAQVGLAF